VLSKDSLEYKLMNLSSNKLLEYLIKPKYYFRFFDRDTQAINIIGNMEVSDLADNILDINIRIISLFKQKKLWKR